MKKRIDRAGVARRLACIRRAINANQAEFCRKVGVSPQAWNNYERNERLINVEAAVQVCAATNATLDYIYRGLLMGIPAEIANEEHTSEKNIHAA